MGEIILSGVILLPCAFILLGIGISQRKSQKPVGFYTGEKPPAEEELSDVTAWNKKHGEMWILYGIGILLLWIIGCFLKDSFWLIILYVVFFLVPLPLLIWNHHRLIKKYRIK